jgi:4,5:9,10-diseco-3-hydroxy-5,9,17-trioxoandrosta-1(10),2-diene-4-oate hydrolase
VRIGATEEWVQVGGLKVRFQRSGSGSALVLVHGLLGYSFSWRFVIPLLAEGREVFALDMPGSGFSDCEAKLDCRLQSAAQRLLGFMDAVGISACDLVGSSYGGSTALMAASLAPARVRTLVLVSPANPWSKIGRKRLGLLKIPLMSAIFPPGARICTPLNAFSLSRMFGDSRRMPADTIRGYGRVLARHGVLEHAVKIVRMWHADMQEFEAALPRVAGIPALLLWGSKDRVVDSGSAELLRRSFHAAQTAIIEGAGHLPYEESPEEFSRIVLGFLSKHSPVVLGGK